MRIVQKRALDVHCAEMVAGHLTRAGLGDGAGPVKLYDRVRLVETITMHPPGAFHTFTFSDGTESPKYNGADDILVVEL